MKQRKEGTHMRNEGENENERYNNNNKNVQQLTAKNRNNVFHELAPVMNYRTRIRTDEKKKRVAERKDLFKRTLFVH